MISRVAIPKVLKTFIALLMTTHEGFVNSSSWIHGLGVWVLLSGVWGLGFGV